MERLVIMTVGKSHSAKMAFARLLEQQLPGSIMIDQDNHAIFVNTYYKALQPRQASNTLKHAITQTILQYAAQNKQNHIILCSFNRSRKGRNELLSPFIQNHFVSVLVHVDFTDDMMRKRMKPSGYITALFKKTSAFEELLKRQQANSRMQELNAPIEGEADHLFVIKSERDIQAVIEAIVTTAARRTSP